MKKFVRFSSSVRREESLKEFAETIPEENAADLKFDRPTAEPIYFCIHLSISERTMVVLLVASQ